MLYSTERNDITAQMNFLDHTGDFAFLLNEHKAADYSYNTKAARFDFKSGGGKRDLI